MFYTIPTVTPYPVVLLVFRLCMSAFGVMHRPGLVRNVPAASADLCSDVPHQGTDQS